MSASGERLGDEARQRQLAEIIAEEEQRLGPFKPTVSESPTLLVEQNWNAVRWGLSASGQTTHPFEIPSSNPLPSLEAPETLPEA